MAEYIVDARPSDLFGIKMTGYIVRCKDCKYRPTPPKAWGAEINGQWCYWCEHHKSWKPDDWFCADGRKDGDGDGN